MPSKTRDSEHGTHGGQQRMPPEGLARASSTRGPRIQLRDRGIPQQLILFEGPGYRTQFCQQRMPHEGLACASSTRGPRIQLRDWGIPSMEPHMAEFFFFFFFRFSSLLGINSFRYERWPLLTGTIERSCPTYTTREAMLHGLPPWSPSCGSGG